MHTLITIVIFSLFAVISAYQITVPNVVQGWTNSGSQLLTWQRVDSDPVNFTVVLVNQDQSMYPSPGYSQELVALVDGSLGSIQVNPPSAGWPTGGHFRVNLVRDPQSLSSILTQSSEFNITSSSSSTAALSTGHGTTVVVPPTTPTATDTSTASPAFTNTNAGKNLVTSAGLFGTLSLITSLLLA